MTDAERQEFLETLGESEEVDFTPYEFHFISVCMFKRAYDDEQRKVIDGMIAKYAKEIDWP